MKISFNKIRKDSQVRRIYESSLHHYRFSVLAMNLSLSLFSSQEFLRKKKKKEVRKNEETF